MPPPAIEFTTPAKNAARNIRAPYRSMRDRIKGKELSAKGGERFAHLFIGSLIQ
jgi:hypothetical protein